MYKIRNNNSWLAFSYKLKFLNLFFIQSSSSNISIYVNFRSENNTSFENLIFLCVFLDLLLKNYENFIFIWPYVTILSNKFLNKKIYILHHTLLVCIFFSSKNLSFQKDISLSFLERHLFYSDNYVYCRYMLYCMSWINKKLFTNI